MGFTRIRKQIYVCPENVKDDLRWYSEKFTLKLILNSVSLSFLMPRKKIGQDPEITEFCFSMKKKTWRTRSYGAFITFLLEIDFAVENFDFHTKFLINGNFYQM